MMLCILWDISKRTVFGILTFMMSNIFSPVFSSYNSFLDMSYQFLSFQLGARQILLCRFGPQRGEGVVPERAEYATLVFDGLPKSACLSVSPSLGLSAEALGVTKYHMI